MSDFFDKLPSLFHDMDDKHSLHAQVNTAYIGVRLLEMESRGLKHFEAQVFGSFLLTHDVDLPSFGVHISKQRYASLSEVSEYYKARIRVAAFTLDGFFDGIERLERAIGLLNLGSIVTSGIETTDGLGASVHYRCDLLHRPSYERLPLGEVSIFSRNTLAEIGRQPEAVQERVWRALWWMRQGRVDSWSGQPRPSLFVLYVSYWNAFEILVETMLVKEGVKGANGPALRDRAAQAVISANKYLAEANSAESLNVVNALEKCFERMPKKDRLYQVRNDINHGTIEEFRLEQRVRVRHRLSELSGVVMPMLNAAIL